MHPKVLDRILICLFSHVSLLCKISCYVKYLCRKNHYSQHFCPFFTKRFNLAHLGRVVHLLRELEFMKMKYICQRPPVVNKVKVPQSTWHKFWNRINIKYTWIHWLIRRTIFARENVSSWAFWKTYTILAILGTVGEEKVLLDPLKILGWAWKLNWQNQITRRKTQVLHDPGAFLRKWRPKDTVGPEYFYARLNK